MSSKRVLILVGTRPEAVKMAPVIRELRTRSRLETAVCATGQHREMLGQTLADFDIVPDMDLEVMTSNQSLASLSSLLFARLDSLMAAMKPDWLLIQGDTTTVMIAALCAFYRKIRAGHIEAGLRSFNMLSPFPEELNRRVASLVAHVHFAPTRAAMKNLVREGVDADRILVTGNTVVDALNWRLTRLPDTPLPGLDLNALRMKGAKLVLVTAHRRENLGHPLENICEALLTVAAQNPEARFVYPVHLNPGVRKTVLAKLSGVSNILLTDPLPHSSLLALMNRCDFVLTDSGGIQEEACVLKKPVLVLRDTTERLEGVNAGVAKLLGTDRENIIRHVSALLEDAKLRAGMAQAAGALYGDGKASIRIADYLENAL